MHMNFVLHSLPSFFIISFYCCALLKLPIRSQLIDIIFLRNMFKQLTYTYYNKLFSYLHIS